METEITSTSLFNHAMPTSSQHLQFRQEGPLHALIHDQGNGRSMEGSFHGWKEWNSQKLHRLHQRTLGLLCGWCWRRSTSTATTTQTGKRHSRWIHCTIQDLHRMHKGHRWQTAYQYFMEGINLGILLGQNPLPTTIGDWYNSATKFNSQHRRFQEILGRRKGPMGF